MRIILYARIMSTRTRAEPVPDLTFLLSWASHALTTEHTAGLARLGISSRAYCVLLKATTGDLTQKQLAEQCGIDKTTMVVTLDELERSGLAERRPSSTDRRARIISVTPAGERVLAEAREISDRIHGDVLAALPEEDRQVFMDALAKLVEGRLATTVPCERPVRRRAPRAP
jgi:MarR family transcriptional regulator, transcriptional regulator for hemolysin